MINPAPNPGNIPQVRNLVRTRIPTRHGEFQLYYYENAREKKEHLALVKGDVAGASDVPVRVHSECLTGDVFGSLRCDCGDQLDRAMRIIGSSSRGVLLYLRQEGRGIGLLKKLQAYNLQDEGLDTVEANLRLGHRSDEREYDIAAAILADLQIRSVRLITNNPLKIEELRALGIAVSERISIEIPYNEENEGYLRTKARKMRHLLSLDAGQSFLGSWTKSREAQQDLRERPFVSLSYGLSLDGDKFAASDLLETGLGRELLGRQDALLLDGALLATDFFQGLDWASYPRLRLLVLDSSMADAISWPLSLPGGGALLLTTGDSATTAEIHQNSQISLLAAGFQSSAKPDPASLQTVLAGLDLRSLLVLAPEYWLGQADSVGAVDYCFVAIASNRPNHPAPEQFQPPRLTKNIALTQEGRTVLHGAVNPSDA